MTSDYRNDIDQTNDEYHYWKPNIINPIILLTSKPIVISAWNNSSPNVQPIIPGSCIWGKAENISENR